VNDNLTGPRAAYLQSRRGVPPHSIEPDHPEDGTITFLGGESGSGLGQKSEFDRRVARQRIAQERLHSYARTSTSSAKLTLNLGVRYTIFGLFNERNGLAEPFDFDTCGPQGYCTVGAGFATRTLAMSIHAWASPGRLPRAQKH